MSKLVEFPTHVDFLYKNANDVDDIPIQPLATTFCDMELG
jgi:hypothetical protein